jgi:hypothetical protein
MLHSPARSPCSFSSLLPGTAARSSSEVAACRTASRCRACCCKAAENPGTHCPSKIDRTARLRNDLITPQTYRDTVLPCRGIIDAKKEKLNRAVERTAEQDNAQYDRCRSTRAASKGGKSGTPCQSRTDVGHPARSDRRASHCSTASRTRALRDLPISRADRSSASTSHSFK